MTDTPEHYIRLLGADIYGDGWHWSDDDEWSIPDGGFIRLDPPRGYVGIATAVVVVAGPRGSIVHVTMGCASASQTLTSSVANVVAFAGCVTDSATLTIEALRVAKPIEGEAGR